MSKKKQPKSGAPQPRRRPASVPPRITNQAAETIDGLPPARAIAHSITGIPPGQGARVDRSSAMEIARAVVAVQGGSGHDTAKAEGMVRELEAAGFFKVLWDE